MTVALLRARWLPVVAATLFAARHASAQDWTYGVNVGAAQGGFSGSQEFNWSHPAPSGSVFLAQPFARGFWLQPELGYSRKVGISTTPLSKLTLAADYLEVPVLFQYRWRGIAAPVSPFVQLGPAFAIRMRCTLELTGSGIRTQDDCDVVRGETSQKVDVNITGGIGLAMVVAGTRLTFEGRASTGMLASAAPVDATNPRSFGWSVLIGASRVSRGMSVPPISVPGPRSPAPVLPSVAGASEPAVPPLVMANGHALPALAGATEPAGPRLAMATIVSPNRARQPTAVRPWTDPLAALGSTRLVSVWAISADAQTLLVAVAREAGLDLVVHGTLRARVSVLLTDVTAADAIRAIIWRAGLAIYGPDMSGANASIVFYQLPVNTEHVSAATIAARTGVSAELANFIVESRPKPKAP